VKHFSWLLLFVLALPCKSQSQHPSNSTSVKKTQPLETQTQSDIPTRSLNFTKGDPLPGVTAAPLISLPIHCTSDGSLLLDMLNPLKPNEHTFTRIHSNESRTYSFNSIKQLKDVQFWDVFPSNSEISFLIKGTKEIEEAPQTELMPDGTSKSYTISKGKYDFYIATFGIDGTFKELIEIPVSYQLYHLGVLETGEFVVSGYDSANNVARLLLLSSSGKLIKPIPLPEAIQNYDAQNDSHTDSVIMAALKNIASIQFTSYGDGVLVWRSGTNDPIVSIGAGGLIREVPIRYPKDYILSDALSSTDHWILHLQPQGQPGNGAHDLGKYVYFEVDPADGSVIDKLSLNGANPGTITCENQGIFTALQTDDKANKLWLLRAN
jgi:hypothetical protein